MTQIAAHFMQDDGPSNWHIIDVPEQHLTFRAPFAQEIAAPLQERKRPQLPNIFAGRAYIPSCLPFQAVVEGMQDAASGADRWIRSDDQAPYFTHKKEVGTTMIEYKTGKQDEVFTDKTTTSLWLQVKQISDLDVDVLLGIFAQLIRCPEEDGQVWFFADNFLDSRGVQPRIQADMPGGAKRRAGHRQEDIAEIERSIGRIENIWLVISQHIEERTEGRKKKTRKRREYTHRGRLLTVGESWFQRELGSDVFSNKGMEIGWKIRPGDWLKTFLDSPNRQVAHLCQKTLEYDPYHQQWEKRLSRYFMFHGRINARGAGITFNRQIGPLLAELSLPLDDRYPQRTRDRFEKSMNKLIDDRQIDAWEYKEKVDLPARGWFSTWQTQLFTIHIAPLREALP